MNKLFLTLLIVTCVSSMCFAEEASAPSSIDNSTTSAQVSSDTAQLAQASSAAVAPTQVSSSTTAATPDKTTTFTGIVNLTSSSQMTVKDDKGQETTFAIASDAAVIGKDGNATTADWISRDDKVSIEYTAALDGSKTAKSIRILSDL